MASPVERDTTLWPAEQDEGIPISQMNTYTAVDRIVEFVIGSALCVGCGFGLEWAVDNFGNPDVTVGKYNILVIGSITAGIVGLVFVAESLLCYHQRTQIVSTLWGALTFQTNSGFEPI